jgi:protein involved in polysaccharide export with SLBB domain
MLDSRWLRRFAPFALCVAVCSCSAAKGPGLDEIAPEINATLAANITVVMPGDLLAITFRQKPEYNQETPVLPDGTASLLEIGTVPVAGRTLDQVAELLAEGYQRQSTVPPSVAIIASAPRTVTVMGEVLEPGAYELGPDGRVTLLAALGQAGGHLKQTAWLSNTLLIRWDPSVQQQRTWVIDARPEHWRGTEPVYLQQHDVIFVPNTNVDEVALWVDNYIRRMIPLPLFPIL